MGAPHDEPLDSVERMLQDSAARRRPDPMLGAVVAGKYRVIDLLAAGGMGRIYRATQEPLGRVVALKFLHPQFVDDEEGQFEKRFFLEAKTCAGLNHPNVVTVFDYGLHETEEGSGYFMVMELLGGQTLSHVLEAEGPLVPPRAARIAREIARALRAAHRHGVVHRDLKPSNVMIVQSDEQLGGEAIKVVDFGLAKPVQRDVERLTRTGRFIGSPRYMAPEQIREQPVDGRADIYALGAILYQMLCGHAPFEYDMPAQTLIAHITEAVPPLEERVPRPVPPSLVSIVMRCLQKDPEGRFPDADAFIGALDQVAGVPLSPEPTHAIGVSTAVVAAPRPVARPGGRRAALIAAVLFLVAAAAFGAALVMRGSGAAGTRADEPATGGVQGGSTTSTSTSSTTAVAPAAVPAVPVTAPVPSAAPAPPSSPVQARPAAPRKPRPAPPAPAKPPAPKPTPGFDGLLSR